MTQLDSRSRQSQRPGVRSDGGSHRRAAPGRRRRLLIVGVPIAVAALVAGLLVAGQVIGGRA